MKKSSSNKSPSLPSKLEVQKWIALLNGIAAKLSTVGVVLTPEERRALAKPRPGSKDLVPTLASMAEQHGVQVAGIDLQRHLDVITTLEPLAERLQAVSTLASDTLLASQAGSWKGTTSMYTILSRIAVDNPELRLGLERVTEFFVAPHRSKRGKKTPPATVAAPSVTTAPAVNGSPPAGDAPATVPTNGAHAPAPAAPSLVN